MPIDTQVPGSDGWWLLYLAQKLEARNRDRLSKLAAYFGGNPPLPTGAENAHKAYQSFQRKARTNFAELVVEATRERLTPLGIRTGAEQDRAGDQQAWLWWQAAGMDVKVADVFESMLALGDGYMIVGLTEDRQPVITAEDPRQVVTAHDPMDQRNVIAALKLFHDPFVEADFAYLYFPGRVRVAVRPRRVGLLQGPFPTFLSTAWEWDDERSADYPAGLEDVMPVVRFRNRNGVGEFERHLDLLDRINHMLLQRMVIATMQAFRQRALKGGAEMPETYPDGHPQAGEPIDYDSIFVADPGALWLIPGTADIWESGQADLTPILSAVKDDVRHLSAVTRTPLSMFDPDGANQTAEGASSSREGLVMKVLDRQMRARDGLVDVLALAFRLTGDVARAQRDQLGIVWAPVERRSLAERADAASKAANDMDVETRLVEIWQMDPHAQARRIAASLPPPVPTVPAAQTTE